MGESKVIEQYTPLNPQTCSYIILCFYIEVPIFPIFSGLKFLYSYIFIPHHSGIPRSRRRQAGADRLRPAWWLCLPPLYGASVAHDGREFLDNPDRADEDGAPEAMYLRPDADDEILAVFDFPQGKVLN